MIQELLVNEAEHIRFICAWYRMHVYVHVVEFELIKDGWVYAGFVSAKIACCGQGPYNGLGLCTPLSNLCDNRDLYAFWDAFHPSEKANKIIVEQMMTGSTEYMSPMNLSTILALDSQK